MGLGSGFDDLWFLPLLFSFFIVSHAPSSFDMGCTKYMQRVRFGYRRAIPVMVFNIVGVCDGPIIRARHVGCLLCILLFAGLHFHVGPGCEGGLVGG